MHLILVFVCFLAVRVWRVKFGFGFVELVIVQRCVDGESKAVGFVVGTVAVLVTAPTPPHISISP